MKVNSVSWFRLRRVYMHMHIRDGWTIFKRIMQFCKHAPCYIIYTDQGRNFESPLLTGPTPSGDSNDAGLPHLWRVHPLWTCIFKIHFNLRQVTACKHALTNCLYTSLYKKGYNVQKDVTLSPSLSGFVTMCMVRMHISTCSIQSYRSINDRMSCANPFKVGEATMVWLHCLAVLVASPHNFFASGTQGP